MGVPCIPNLEPFIAAGLDPKTGLPFKSSVMTDPQIKDKIKKQLRIVDEQDAVNRYVWNNLPKGIDGKRMIERILYYKGQGMLFFEPTLERYFFLPYALEGSIDVYGRFMGVKPVPMGSTTAEKDPAKDAVDKAQEAWLAGIHRVPIYTPEETETATKEQNCVLLSDYTQQLSRTIQPRWMVNDGLLEIMANCIPYLNTALQNSTGVDGIRVNDESEASNVEAASLSLQKAALTGRKWVPVTSAIEIQELTNGTKVAPQDFLMAMQGLDNYRLSLYGIDNGGLFQKSTYQTTGQSEMNVSSQTIPMLDGLELRQQFCEVANKIFGENIEVAAQQFQVSGIGSPDETPEEEAQTNE